jgi:hypothetical protein
VGWWRCSLSLHLNEYSLFEYDKSCQKVPHCYQNYLFVCLPQGVMSADEDAPAKHVDRGSPSFLEKLGAGTDDMLEDFFHWWGTGEFRGL